VEVELPAGEVTLDLFLENNGRVNYGPYLNDNRKGITERVTFAGRELTGFTMYGFPFEDFSGMKFGPGAVSEGPVVRRGKFVINEVADSYLDMREWGKGAAWLNGRSLGKFWSIGPQQTLYIPAPWLKQGENELIVVELLKPELETTRGLEEPILDLLNKSAP
jgi:beta-galactosidase